MLRAILAASFAMTCLASTADAVERKRLGFGILFTNDFVDGTEDRWRTGSVTSSRVWGPEWTGAAPSGFGDLLELRIHGEVISPANLQSPTAGDRRYAGALSLGLHTHMTRGATELALGADVVFVGPQTQLDEFQSGLHDLFSISEPSDAVLGNQIENEIRPTLVFEAGRSFQVGSNSALRPFIEARAGIETLARVGVDWTFGGLGQGALMVREPVAGQRYEVVGSEWTGTSFVLGADIAYVDSSVFLPDDGTGPALEETRHRLRAGVAWQRPSGFNAFVGLSYLGEEFEGQDEGQFVGALRVGFGF
ncbi:lipid A-modifier LpxR family protein [Tateyamaria sp. SN6-1]|uniref:lipid A-modifier LpxR family protein n=1 Tax=Tateyamaria sp. SN6-1 TaxID=3092148 RepID=UPI0039F4F439